MSGKFEGGTLHVSNTLKICTTGIVKGDLIYGNIVIEQGAVVAGTMSFGRDKKR